MCMCVPILIHRDSEKKEGGKGEWTLRSVFELYWSESSVLFPFLFLICSLWS